MKTMKAAEFKAKCLKVMDELAESGEEIVITKRGKAIARLLPPAPIEPPKIGWGAGAHFYIPYEADLASPTTDPDDWTDDAANLFPEEHAPRADPTGDE